MTAAHASPSYNPDEEFAIRVLTLNCWGLWLGAKKRRQRIAGIVKYLRKNNCDIVFLQEVWVTSDFEIIRNGTRDMYRFAHLFRSGSVLGSSGIVILCKWLPRVIHFEPYSLNGSPFYPWHGDWFAGKGIAYSRVDFNGLSLHLFSTHTHAYYKDNEPLHDQYSVHRVCQSYQLAKFVNFITDTACNRKTNGKDLLIVAGDMNSTSSELPYKIITTMVGLTDCFKMPRPNEPHTSNISQKYNIDTDEEDITYYHPGNSFTPNNIEQRKLPKKRIDFILCRLLTHGHCVVDRVKGTVDVDMDCSLSDHEPVMVELKISDISHDLMLKNRIASCSESCSEPTARASSRSSSNNEHSRPLAAVVDSNVTPSDASQIEETTNPWVPEMASLNMSYHECNLQLLEETQGILKQYYIYNQAAKTQLFYIALLMFIVTLPTTTYYALENDLIPISTIVFMWFAASFLFAIGLLVGFLSYRFEQGAIEAILNDINCLIPN